MMKSFFKKLAFVMALAMVVTMAAPAAAKAYAADMYLAYQGKKAAVSEINLKAGSKEDLCFKNAPANWAELSKTWASDNEAVAVVDKNGVVTAIADGTAKITFTLGDGTAASVTVNVGEAKVYDVVLGTAKDNTFAAAELKTGATLDLNFYGIKDWSANKYTVAWSSNAPEVAVVDKNGIVTAVKAGSATVTAAIVNTETGATMNVTPVVVTVPEEKKADAFTVAQVNLTKFAMTFEAKKDVKAEDVAVVMMINDVEAPVPVKAVAVKENVATVEMFSEFVEGVTYKVTYGKTTAAFVGSVGAIDKVAFSYATDKVANVAYVSTEEEPSVAVLTYTLYDANGVDVTSAYDEDELTIEYNVVNESEDYEVIDNELIFYEAGAAVVEVKVVWTSEDGDEVEKTGNGVVVATKRPALSHNLVEAGFIRAEQYLEGAVADFTGNKDSFFWKDNAYNNSWILGDNSSDTFQFAAVVKDNRGNTVVTGINEYGENYKEDSDGNLVYPYGYFKFVTSNDEVVDVDEEGILSFWDDGSASIITYFVDTTGEEEKEVFVGATKISVSPKRYVASYAIADTTATVAAKSTDGTQNLASFVLTAFDQYGANIDLKNKAADITVETTSSAEDIPVKEVSAERSSETTKPWGTDDCSGWWCGNSKGGVHYHITFDGDDFEEYLGTKTAKTVQYAVTVNKDENSKISTNGTTKIKLTVKDTVDYADDLSAALWGGDGAADKFYYSVGGGEGVDLAVTYAKNFSKTNADATVKSKEISMNYLNTTNGFTMTAVPTENIIEMVEDQTTGEAGKLYFEVTAPKGAYDNDKNPKNWSYSAGWGKIAFTWNTADGDDTLNYAATGDYKVTVYYVKNTSIDDGEGKLSKLGTYTYNITNSQASPKFAGYNNKLGNKTTTPITDDNALEIIKENLVFTLDGATIDWEAEDFRIAIKDVVVTDKKLRVNKVTIYVPIDDGNDATSYTYKKDVTVGKTIYFEEEE